jgi:hypothetical protein
MEEEYLNHMKNLMQTQNQSFKEKINNVEEKVKELINTSTEKQIDMQ